MFKVDKLMRFLDCDLCNRLLVDPVMMICGKAMCKSHLDKLLCDIENTFICVLCQEEHTIPKKGFDVNERFQCLLGFELNNIDAGPFYDGCKKEIEEAQSNFNEFDSSKELGELHLRVFRRHENYKRRH